MKYYSLNGRFYEAIRINFHEQLRTELFGGKILGEHKQSIFWSRFQPAFLRGPIIIIFSSTFGFCKEHSMVLRERHMTVPYCADLTGTITQTHIERQHFSWLGLNTASLQ